MISCVITFFSQGTHLKELLHIYGNPKNSLKNLRLLAICFTAYAGFLRYDELANLRFSDLKFYNDYVKIFIEESKTDIYRQGFWVHIAQTFKSTCPLAILSNYVRQAKFTDDSDLFLFRALVFKRKSKNHILRKTNKLFPTLKPEELSLRRL